MTATGGNGPESAATPTLFENLSAIWGRLLPHRSLVIDGDDINVRYPDSGAVYPASQMSDGERAILYLVGQALVANRDSVLIVDEPELHLHPAVMTALWDELAAARPDCVFFFITHSLEFAASRPGRKYMIQDFHPAPLWTLQELPEDSGFSEDFTTLILGSRRPVLFVEGNAATSVDKLIYRSCYPDHLVVPRESSSAVIHAVTSMRANADFTRISCQGIVDRDHRTEQEIEYLRSRNVHTLPVAEIENLFLLPDVSRAIAHIEGYDGDTTLTACLDKLRAASFGLVASPADLDRADLGWARRRIDRHLKRLDLSGADDIDELKRRCSDGTASLDVDALASEARNSIRSAVDNNDLPAFLAHYDNKRLFALAAQTLRNDGGKSFKNWLKRILANGSQPQLIDAMRAALPAIVPPGRRQEPPSRRQHGSLEQHHDSRQSRLLHAVRLHRPRRPGRRERHLPQRRNRQADHRAQRSGGPADDEHPAANHGLAGTATSEGEHHQPRPRRRRVHRAEVPLGIRTLRRAGQPGALARRDNAAVPVRRGPRVPPNTRDVGLLTRQPSSRTRCRLLTLGRGRAPARTARRVPAVSAAF